MKKELIPAGQAQFKANLHCHSVYSDGALTPAQLKEVYMAQGYSAIAFTDHDVFIPHPELTDEHFVALNGYEMEINETGKPGKYARTTHIVLVALDPDTQNQVCYHRSDYLFGNAANQRDLLHFDATLPDYVRSYTPECINDMIRRCREGGFYVIYAHPGWSLENYAHYMQLNGMDAMEIVNYSSLVEGDDEMNSKVYDDMLRGDKRIFCVATDDNHNHAPADSHAWDSCGGFTMISAPTLEYRAITSALKQGFSYASMGPRIDALWIEDGQIHIRTSPARRIVYRPAGRHCMARGDLNGALTEASFPLEPDDIYFRLEVEDNAGLRAFTNAYFFDELNA